MYSVGLDVGGTFLKAAWLDGGPLAVTRRPMPGFLDTSGKAREIDPNELISAVTELLDEVIGERECSRILVTGQMAGLAFVDADGNAVSPLISWQDTRVEDLEPLHRSISPDQLARLGDGLRPGLPLVTLSGIDAPPQCFVTSMLGFVAGALTDSRARSLHATDAAALGLLDIATCRWSAPALAVAHLAADRLPDPVADVEIVGTSAQYGAQVTTAVGDAQAALLGSGLALGQISVNIATGCQVSMISPTAVSPTQLRPYFGGLYLQTVTHLPAGRLLREAISSDLGHEPSESEWQESIEGAVDGDTALGQALTTIAGACVQAARRLDSASEIIFSGGVAQRIAYLRELIAQQLRLPYSVFPGDDAALEGLRQLDRV